MAQIHRTVPATCVARVSMRCAKCVRARPVVEVRVAGPDRVARVEHVVVALRPLEQMKFDEAGHFLQVRVARGPDFLECGLGAQCDLEAVHGDIHAAFLFVSENLDKRSGGTDSMTLPSAGPIADYKRPPGRSRRARAALAKSGDAQHPDIRLTPWPPRAAPQARFADFR